MDSGLFAGSLGYDHFGHFLTDQISRLWPVLDGGQDCCPILFHHGKAIHNQPVKAASFAELPRYQRKVLSALHPHLSESLQFLDGGVRIRRCMLPEPSIVIRNRISPVHSSLTRHCARVVLAKHQAPRLSRRVYFSRSRLGEDQRLAIGEDVLEQLLLRDFGFDIYHPQELSVADQISLVNSAEVIAGALGSALHNVLFCLESRAKLLCLSAEKINLNYFLIDAVSNVQPHYLQCLSEFVDYRASQTVDVGRAMTLIRQIL